MAAYVDVSYSQLIDILHSWSRNSINLPHNKMNANKKNEGITDNKQGVWNFCSMLKNARQLVVAHEIDL